MFAQRQKLYTVLCEYSEKDFLICMDLKEFDQVYILSNDYTMVLLLPFLKSFLANLYDNANQKNFQVQFYL